MLMKTSIKYQLFFFFFFSFGFESLACQLNQSCITVQCDQNNREQKGEKCFVVAQIEVKGLGNVRSVTRVSFKRQQPKDKCRAEPGIKNRRSWKSKPLCLEPSGPVFSEDHRVGLWSVLGS